jgi:hypothetical protein
MVVGDFLFNLRCSLDHLIWQLTILNGATPGTKHQFPISKSRDKFDEAIKGKRLAGLSAVAIDEIERWQPYYAGNEALARLNMLHNADKHHKVHLLTAASINTLIPYRGSELTIWLGAEELRHGDVFGNVAVPLVNVPDIRGLYQEGEAEAFVAFDEPGAEELEPYRVDSLLPDIYDLVANEIVGSFRPMFS